MVWHKFNAKKTVIDGISFPSKCEADLFSLLKFYQLATKLKDIEMQCRVDPGLCPSCGIRAAPSVKIDFRAFDTELNETVYYEAKGVETDRWRLFLAWWRDSGPARLRIYKPSNSKAGVKMVEEVIPNETPWGNPPEAA